MAEYGEKPIFDPDQAGAQDLQTLVNGALKEAYPFDQGSQRAGIISAALGLVARLTQAREGSPSEQRED